MSNSPPERTPAIAAAGLVKTYEQGRVRALDGLSVRIEAGEFIAVCGPSGCGKSTLLNLLAGIDRPDAGTLHVCGNDLGALPPRALDGFRAAQVGFIFQLHNLLPTLTALENVQVPMLALENGTRPKPAERVERATELLERVGLGSRLRARPPTLSGGERQRVAIARALANSPRLLLADEPTGALDSRNGEVLFELLLELQRESGTTLVVVTHDEHLAQRAARTLSMLDGRIIADSAATAAQ
jgi:putative ABC transport system ATP-binding protein